MTKTEKMRNAFYAMAIADAVGNVFEFKSNIDPNAVIAYANGASGLEITDDTQMALFTAQAIDDFLRSEVPPGNEYLFDEFVNCAYYDWYITQTQVSGGFSPDDGLLQFQSLFKVQAPGLTCLRACEQIGQCTPVENDSMGCGAVMRLLPFAGLFGSGYDAMQLAKISGNATHRHNAVPDAVEHYVLAMVAASSDVSYSPVFDFMLQADSISQLGEGWIAPEAVNMAIWAAAKAKSFDELLALSIAHDGDSDSVGAMAGALWGLAGKDVPIKYIEKIVEKDAIEHVLQYKFLRD